VAAETDAAATATKAAASCTRVAESMEPGKKTHRPGETPCLSKEREAGKGRESEERV